jgi:soluble lytic murein transglycosylase-like protein
MGAVKRALCALALFVASPANAQPFDRWTPYISEASVRFGIPTDWIVRVMTVESGGHPTRGGRPIRSRAGAMGLMQLMPKTWAAMRDSYALGTDPDDPRANIFAGTAYLRSMYDRFGYPGLFAAYNAGPGRYARALEGQSALPSETRTYLARLVGSPRPSDLTPPRVPDVLFALREQPLEGTAPMTPQRSPIFIVLGDSEAR